MEKVGGSFQESEKFLEGTTIAAETPWPPGSLGLAALEPSEKIFMNVSYLSVRDLKKAGARS